MTTSRLAKSELQPKRSQQEWIDRGNRILWGQEPTSKGDYLKPRLDLEWRCADGNYFIHTRA